jgi:hypothetical protein
VFEHCSHVFTISPPAFKTMFAAFDF